MGGKVFPESPIVALTAKYVAENPGQTLPEIAENMGFSCGYMKNVLTAARKIKVIDCVQRSRECFWYEPTRAAVELAEVRAKAIIRRRAEEQCRIRWDRVKAGQQTELADAPRVTRTEAGRYPPPMTTAPASVFAWRP